ncbi:UDP-N-acetylmuramoylalanine--D-glutamate ligase [Tepidimonas alkaliphilus]|uniref:UDP-N-acetylmuramoylalanine--D-glutamate ligase n=1 Tax=Tepidimonas alkaliphilus TaxID=2588942 RepID=A0A554W946_9BURK|nr:UDP-N-acetylmuramoyl-L-alanine--D-glutamate ligase [Tepidimonas alkaliphilus]TSE20094.1 UDP-N-acetylmuramoylalanine--D-glutamate ligase [Tepidimonas alkaliphilus]
MTAWRHDLLPTLARRPVLVLGLGASGLALARWLHAAGAAVTVADTRAQPPQAAALQQAAPGARLLAGAALDEALAAQQPWALVARSPGLAPAQWAPLRAAAQAAGVPCVGEVELFAAALRALEARGGERATVLAITGTNGKTTTTALTGHLLRALGWDVAVAGNIGPTLLATLAERLQQGRLPRAWVLELSSFQLDGVEGFEPTAATVLNVTQDHLDWHGSLEAYAAAKARIFGTQGLMLLNRDDPIVWAWRPAEPAPAARGAARRRAAAVRPWASFGLGLPARPGDWGLETAGGVTWLVRALPEAEPVPGEPLPLQRLLPAEALRIQGRHNAANALAALALATAAGAPLAPLLHALRDYRGEPHRVQPVAIVREVEYIDDSKGTNVGATLAALEGLGAQRPLVVILGGDGKGQDFTPLAPAVARHARAVALIGRDAPALQEALQGCGVPLQRCADLPSAVRWCAQQARPGDAVLLSPACASLDMFRDYAHRAEVFVDAVRALQDEEGTPA